MAAMWDLQQTCLCFSSTIWGCQNPEHDTPKYDTLGDIDFPQSFCESLPSALPFW